MTSEVFRDPDFEWLDLVQPTGLLVGRNLLKTLGLIPERQTQVHSAELEALIGPDLTRPALQDAWAFAATILGWETRHVAGAPGGEPIPDNLLLRLPEHDTTLRPTWAVRELGVTQERFQLLVSIEAGVDLDKRGALGGWEATPHQRFERLLRESGVFAGLIIGDAELRLVYAPKGETSGWLSFPIRALRTVAGRPMLGGLKLLLDRVRLFTDSTDRRLPALLSRSRIEQAAVSTALAEQVLGALHELLRGLDAAEPTAIRKLAQEQPEHLYEGLLTVLMRLVFVLYAEDRELLPSLSDPHAKDVYEQSYSVRGLYGKLVEDAAHYPDTMDERRGGWGRLLALFRLIHAGHPSHFIQARGGKLFDPEAFPFLEGRFREGNPPRVMNVSDGCLLRMLEGLMTLDGGRGVGRERLSYRTLDVEQIGSVYETVMGFTVETANGHSLAIKAGKNNKTPVFVPLEKLLAQKGKDRVKFLKEEADRGLTAAQAKPVEAAKTIEDIAAGLDAIVDERASPRKQMTPSGAPILQPTDERRRTGSHYTPRSLTEPIVRYALEPAFERLGPDATPEQILALKVCDPAMGSGAFLVEACRALASRLVAAWTRWPKTRPVIPADEDEELHARRLVAQRCLYGVDKNPLATDLAKLSLWLATLARDHEFTFLDHALKSGDSLVGLDAQQIAAMHWNASKPGLPLFRKFVADRVAEATKVRAEIQSAPDDMMRAVLEQKHKQVENSIELVRVLGDAVISAFFAEDKAKAREKRRATIESWVTGMGEAKWNELRAAAASLRTGEHQLRPFHWVIEFPEVFARENGGFDAIIGNPPFAGKNTIGAGNRAHYLPWLQMLHEAHGAADLAAHFYRRAFILLRQKGAFGLVATQTIFQGDTRDSGLARILKAGGNIYHAIRRYKWRGDAQVTVAIIHILKGDAQIVTLDNKVVERISAYLVNGSLDEAPVRLAENTRCAFKGSLVLGMGFTFDDAAAEKGQASTISEMHDLVSRNPLNSERIFPYIGGEELNNSPSLTHKRYVIDFGDLSESEARRNWPDLFSIIEQKVRPQRLKDKRKAYRDNWWRFAERRVGMLHALLGKKRVLAICEITPHLAFGFLPAGMVYAHTLKIFATESNAFFSVIQSRIHEIWARALASTFEDRIIYSPTDAYANFALPADLPGIAELGHSGCVYHEHRAALMVARNEGMTKTYNRFHDRNERGEDIVRLRELHADMDRAVLRAYGWDDLVSHAEAIFLDETNEDDHTYQGRLFWPSDFRDELLSRLLALNAERHADEVRRGVATGMKGSSREENEDEEEEFA